MSSGKFFNRNSSRFVGCLSDVLQAVCIITFNIERATLLHLRERPPKILRIRTRNMAITMTGLARVRG
jgi:hypothetical protein